VTGILYEGDRRPSAVNRAVAELADLQRLLGPGDRRGYGWMTLMTYNFDDLMGEALDDRGIPRASYSIRKDQVAGDPNEHARAGGQDAPHLPVLHLHGYTPRRFFYITDVKFVFSTSQYLSAYAPGRRPLLDSVYEQLLASPTARAVYIGCSFADPYMNDLLRRSREQMPGTEHWAFLQWPGGRRYAGATPQEIEEHSQRYVAFGVRPVWYDDHAELADLIRRLK
jgi:hypothetical protein